ncbi:membrane-associated protein, putative [Bodo saltans]|uniref:Membrane-associated protein, putative n=1 Tax=Bodo saltans TaxID=75058 RepID=A0A0S4J2J2_BODSA|nr:membrane-associated protein, putative [Bodo saltans]|eukprot:CUG60765.1 membrane-associated protein, putative [Bodo saltans]
MKTMDQEERTPLRAEAMTRTSMVSMQLLLALNAALMFVVLLSGWSIYQDVSQKLRAAEDIISTPEKLAPYAEVIIRDAASSFLFGAINGSIAQFVGDIARPEIFASLGASVSTFTGSVISAFGGAPPLSCSDYIDCPNSQNGQYPFAMQCNSGAVVWCQYGGQQINCASQSCVAPYVYSVATFANTISALLTQLSGPSQSTNSDAAFSTGVFNLAAVIPWVQRQANANDWFNAGIRCQNLVQKVNSVSWNGEYIDFDGRSHIFNVTNHVTDATAYVKQVCDDLVKLSAQMKEKK